MSRFFWFPWLSLLLAALVVQMLYCFTFVANLNTQVLTTPQGLALIPLSFDIPATVVYLKPYTAMEPGATGLKYVQAILPIYAAAAFFLFTGAFLYIFSRVRRLERAYVIFASAVVAYLLLFVDFFTLHLTGSFFLCYNLLIIAPFIYLYRSVYELTTHARYYASMVMITIAAFWFLPVASPADELQFIKILGIAFFFVFLYCGFIFFRVEFDPEKTLSGKKMWASRILNLSLIFAVALPPVFFFMLYYVPVQLDVNYNAFFFLPAFFPIIFLTLALRGGVVAFHVPISLTAIRLTYFTFFGFLYWFTIGYSLSEIDGSRAAKFGHLGVLGLFLLLIDPLRTALLTSLDSYAVNRRKVLDAFLLQSAGEIANPRRVNHFIERLANSLSEGVGSVSVKVVMSRDLFSTWRSENDKVIYLPPDDPFWVASQTWVHRGTSPYRLLTQTFVGPVRDFLQSRGAFMFVGMEKFKAGLLVAERRDGTPYYGEDVSFLRRVAHESETLIQNYVYLIEHLKLQKRERELATSARIQKRMIPGHKEFERFGFWSYSRAYESVTGDYLDLIEISPDSFVVLLGDVSGHGISSGYLATFARAYLRGTLLSEGQKGDLAAALIGLNDYMAENYSGHEFITLFALKLDFLETGITLSYINAGQHPAIVDRGNGLVELDETQRLLGVTETVYNVTQVSLDRERTRIILYSDGAFDVFNKSGKHLGHKKFHEWITASINSSPADQLAFLRQRIETYTASGEESDDLALIIIQTS